MLRAFTFLVSIFICAALASPQMSTKDFQRAYEQLYNPIPLVRNEAELRLRSAELTDAQLRILIQSKKQPIVLFGLKLVADLNRDALVPLLSNYALGKNKAIAAQALYSLSRIAPREATGIARRLESSTSPIVLVEVIRVLRESREERDLKFLSRILHVAKDEAVLASAIRATPPLLTGPYRSEALGDLLEYSRHRTPSVRIAVADVLGRMEEEFASKLVKYMMIYDPEEQVRETAFRSYEAQLARQKRSREQ